MKASKNKFAGVSPVFMVRCSARGCGEPCGGSRSQRNPNGYIVDGMPSRGRQRLDGPYRDVPSSGEKKLLCHREDSDQSRLENRSGQRNVRMSEIPLFEPRSIMNKRDSINQTRGTASVFDTDGPTSRRGSQTHRGTRSPSSTDEPRLPHVHETETIPAPELLEMLASPFSS